MLETEDIKEYFPENVNIHLDVNGATEVLKEKLIYFSNQKWIETIQSSGRYDVYKSFKPFRYKKIYISVLIIKSHQKLLARFRMGMSNIFTDKCRFLVDESFIWPLCIEEEENELHFLLQCPVYHDLRLKYLHPFDSPPTEKTFQNLLATEDHCLIQGVSLYIYHAFQMRENCIFDNNQTYV